MPTTGISVISRRRFLQSALVLPVALHPLATLASRAPEAARTGSLLSAWNDEQGRHFIGALDFSGAELFSFAVEQRAHDCCAGPRGEVLFVARRPGTSFHLIDQLAGKLRKRTVKAPENRHYYGHACFSPDGSQLYLCENDFENQRGLVGVYRVSDLVKVREFETGGIGPHQLAWLPDKKTLVVANGGILTHPDSGREKLNLDQLQSSLAYLDAEDGQLQQLVNCEQAGMSLRHLDISSDGQVFVAAQYQFDDESSQPGLLFAHRAGEKSLQPFEAEAWQWQQHNGYIASVAVNHTGDYVMLTSPRGNVASLWHTHERRLVKTFAVNDVAGVVWNPLTSSFLLSNGHGQLFDINLSASSPALIKTLPGKLWDNHLSLLQGS